MSSLATQHARINSRRYHLVDGGFVDAIALVAAALFRVSWMLFNCSYTLQKRPLLPFYLKFLVGAATAHMHSERNIEQVRLLTSFRQTIALRSDRRILGQIQESAAH